MSKSIQERHWITVALYQRMCALDYGETLTYEQMSEIAGMNILARRWLIQSARDRAFRDDGIVMLTITNEGLQRADADGKVSFIADKVRRIRRAGHRARRATVSMTVAEWGALSPESRRELISQYSQLAGMQRMLQPHTHKAKVEKVMNNSGPRELPAFLKS
jgi:hypothetical protein